MCEREIESVCVCVRVNNFPISCNLISVVMRSLPFSVLSFQRRLIVVIFQAGEGGGVGKGCRTLIAFCCNM